MIIWLWARQNDAQILLRIDDIDQTRVKPEFIDDIFETLDWLGIDWDLGPGNADDHIQNWSQAHRMDGYLRAIESLINSGHAYRCHCTRSVWAVSGYDSCNCAFGGADSDDYVIRLTHFPPSSTFTDLWMGEQTVTFDRNTQAGILLRRDGFPSYQITSVIDDVEFEVTHVIRGEDLIESTANQLQLSEKLDLKSFASIGFMHHPLVRSGGEKLSKSSGSTSIKHLRESGMSPREFYKWLGSCFGLENLEGLSDLYVRYRDGLNPLTENRDWSIS